MRRRLLNMKRGGSGYDTDFQAWLNYNALQGHYMTSDTVKLDAANQYVIDSKADGTWSGKDVFHLFAWNDLQMDDASLVCLKRLIKVDVYGGMTYTINGWQGNNIDGYIDTKFNPAVDGVNFTLNNAGRGVLEFSDDSRNATDSIYFGIAVTGGGNVMMNRNTASQCLNSNNNTVTPNPNIVGIGLKTNYRDNSTDVRFYYIQNEYLGTQTSSSVNYSNNITLFRNGGSVYSNCGSGILLFSKSFTQTENESIRTNLNTYLTSIGLTPIA